MGLEAGGSGGTTASVSPALHPEVMVQVALYRGLPSKSNSVMLGARAAPPVPPASSTKVTTWGALGLRGEDPAREMFTGWFQGMTEGVTTALREGVGEVRAESEMEGVTEVVEEADWVGVALGHTESLGRARRLREVEGECVALGQAEALVLTVGPASRQGVAVREEARVALLLVERDWLPEGVSVEELEREGDRLALWHLDAAEEAEGECVTVMEGLLERDREGLTVTEGDAVCVCDREGLVLALGVLLATWERLEVPQTVAREERELLIVTLRERVGEGDADAELEPEGVAGPCVCPRRDPDRRRRRKTWWTNIWIVFSRYSVRG